MICHRIGNGTSATLIRTHFNPVNGKSPSDDYYYDVPIKTKASRWLIAAKIASAIVVAVVIGFVVRYGTWSGMLS